MQAQLRQFALPRRCGESGYPQGLLDLKDPPPLLWTAGKAAAWTGRWVAIVGSRSADLRGARAARELATVVIRMGAGVLSGGAMGIDAEAHAAALDGGGPTVVVLASGVDRPGPRYNESLFRRILAQEGGFWSERAMGAAASRGAFVRRNRLIAAGAKAVVVVQAHRRSGSLSTALHALRLGRPVWVVPGGYGDEGRRGCNWLLSKGALPLISSLDLEKGLVRVGCSEGVPWTPRGAQAGAASGGLDDLDQAVLEALIGGARGVEEVVSMSGYPVQSCLAAMTRLELAGKWSS